MSTARERQQRRLEGIAGLRGKYVMLGVEEVASAMEYFETQLGQGSQRSPLPGWRTQTVDTYRLEPEEVRALLLGFPLNNEAVELLWPFHRVGIRLNYSDLVQHYDDLWFPSADDIWVLAPSRDRLLSLDHEEIVTFAMNDVG